jgi:hypothetical protein
MRTGTHFCTGGTEDFIKTVNNFYPAGKIAVFSDDREKAVNLIKFLGENYNALSYGTEEKPELPLSCRFIIGAGGTDVIAPVKRAAVSGAKFAFLPSVFDYRFLHNFDGNRALPEFVFLTETALENNFAVNAYVSVFELYSETAFDLCYGGLYPYRDKGLFAVNAALKKVLLCELDKADFQSECARLVSLSVNELFARNKKAFVTEKTAKIYGHSLGDRFSVAYFADLTLLNFTNHVFRDILLPSEGTNGNCVVSCAAFDRTALPTREDLGFFAKKVKFLTEIPPFDKIRMLKALSEAAGASPVFSAINGKGMLDELQNEGLETN